MDRSVTLEEIRHFIADRVGVGTSEIADHADIEHDLGCTGDDFFELLDAYQKMYAVDMSGFLWYFHTYDEGSVSFSLFPRRTPTDEVERIPVTLVKLTAFANLGRWSIEYPEHKLKGRYGWTMSEKVFFYLFVLALAFFAVRSCTN